ncbi:MAG: hypothetical protein DRO73_05525 [Candidatus Thorarchaeota archaeon]|nr:MAG: hypothetical protein DRO73_05525 [Candidatus Thorarchaeota archaeon]
MAPNARGLGRYHGHHVNLGDPAHERTFWIFKMASMYVAFAFFWLFVGPVTTPILTTIPQLDVPFP